MIKNGALKSGQRGTRHWRKSSYSGTAGNCIEVANLGCDGWGMRDSKDPTGPVLTFTADEWLAFIFAVKYASANLASRERFRL